MKLFITGGAGFIGAHVAKAALTAGHTVTLFDDLNDMLYPKDLKIKRLTALVGENAALIEGNILEIDVLNQTIATSEPDIILHFAAHANPGVSLLHANAYTRVNVEGTLNVLQCATANKVNKLIFAGSSSVYNDEQTPFTEDSYPLRPKSPYGAAKAAAENYCAMWHELYGLPVTILRFFSVYGPWGRPDMAPWIFAERLLKGKSIQLNKDNRERDFTYIDDIVDAVMASLTVNIAYEIINVGRGEPINLKQFIQALEYATGMKAKITSRETPPGEMQVTFADITKAKNLLGYNPQTSHEGTKKLVNWMQTELFKNNK
jgi:UDP-glucuronate 4-epimerase